MSTKGEIDKSDEADDHYSPADDPPGCFKDQENGQKAAKRVEEIWDASAKTDVLILDEHINANKEREHEKREINDGDRPVFVSHFHLPCFVALCLKREEEKDESESEGEMDGPLLYTR